jgi:2-(1,2-epoxy-1,2-dihydrophenyl)acetyl-CoA isomerase
LTEALVRYEEAGGLVRLTFNRSDAGNAVTPALIADFAAAVEQATASGCGAVLISGEGPNFCVGADLRHFADKLGALGGELAVMADGFHAALARLAELPVPVVAQVQGAAVGAGFGIALAADYVVCAETARFSTGYAKLGLSSDAGVSYFLTQALGVRLARSLLMTARFVSGPEALTLGLVDECCAADTLAERATAAAERFASGPSGAYAAIKRLTAEAALSGDLRAHLDRERDEIVPLAAGGQMAEAARALAAKTAR